MENQSAFIVGRLITDNVLIAFEMMHYLEHKKEGKDSYMAIKLDMSKAYDRVEWGFTEHVMRKLGFHERWIGLIMRCITTVSYSVLINGVAHGNIMPSRGLRQGDPLSSYLIDILRLYEAASGQKINTDKSSVFFSANTPEEMKVETLDILRSMQDSRHSKYLGLPSIIGKSKMDVFAVIKERVARKLSGWKEKILSISGREILIKAVA